ncbi:response regulator transcription factor [Clostridium cochlearium]|uniref:Stage 0 sporulation protein A homolog n=1 Tax=Clostridium cochlearium TaxID=1494 RepID=A0A7Y3V7R6_CLOCO|nr:response regulator transcription factor [Clostridium cochlearium]NOH15359.1 response regulator transcription factor [Clostridium cochlearium]
MKEKILIVEDDEEIALCIKEYIEKTGYEVLWASTGKEGYEEFKEEKFSLLMIDIMMPEMDGLTLCKNIRLTSDVPILIISAKNEDGDKVRGLNIGADDYITKPFSLVELKARVESHLRRYRRYHGIENNEHILKFKKGLVIYKEGKYVEVDGTNIHLTSKEFELLMLIAENPNKTFKKSELYEILWGEKDVQGNNTVTVHIKELREKLKEDVKNPNFIETVWGTGYKFIGEVLP